MQILHIDSSILGGFSVSRELTKAAVAELVAKNPGAKVEVLDLAVAAPSYLTADALALMGDAATLTDAQKRENAVTDGLIKQLEASDVIVIGAPMYNFSIPAQLRAWIDRVLQAGRTFKYIDGAPVGLVTGKRAVVALSRGGVYSNSDAGNAMEHQESYLRTVLGFIGITDVTFVRAEGLSYGAEVKEKSVAKATQEIAQAV